MAFSDIFEESRKKLQNYFGLGRPGLGTFGQQIKPAVNPIVNFVRQNPSPFKFAQRRIQTPQVQKTIKPAVNFFRQNPTPYSFVNRNVVKPAIDYQRNQIRIANNLANRAITGINTYADRQRQDPLYQTARKIHKYNPASWGGQTATMFAKEAARDLVRLPLQTRASITGKTIKADTPLKRAILGKDIETLGQRRQYNVGELKKYGLSDKWAGRIGTLGTGLAIAGVGLDASDIARLGGKKLLTSLAKEVNPKTIKKILPNISDNVARKIAKTNKVDEIERLLKAPKPEVKLPVKPISEVKLPIKGATTPLAKPIPKELEPLAEKTRKYKSAEIKEFFDKNYDKLSPADQKKLGKIIYDMNGDYYGDAALKLSEEKFLDKIMSGIPKIKVGKSALRGGDVFPSFNEYYSEFGGYKAVTEGADLRENYVKAVIDSLTGKTTEFGKPTPEIVKEARRLIKNHSLYPDEEMRMLDDAVFQSSLIPETGVTPPPVEVSAPKGIKLPLKGEKAIEGLQTGVPPAGKGIERPLETNINDPVEKIVFALKKAKPLSQEQKALTSKLRSEQFAKMMSARGKTSGEKGFYAELGALKGGAKKVDFEAIRPKLEQRDIDELFDRVNDANIGEWEKINAKTSLAKLLSAEGGTIPTQNELKLLNDIFGSDFTKAILDKRSLWQKFMAGAGDVLNLPRSLMASFDLSAPLRQGVFLVGKPKQWVPAFLDMFKQFGSEKAYKAVQESIQAKPTYKIMRQSKLAITDVGSLMSNREERFMSTLAEKIPVIGKGVRASSRAYTGFLNKLRADVFDDLYKKAVYLGQDSPEIANDIAKFVNSATGRGDLGKLNNATVALNGVFFSPRLMASRINLLNPAYYVQLNPIVRKEALKSLLTFGAVASSILGLAKLGGAEVGADPRSADFGKIKVGDTRYDILGGFQQYLVLASRLVTGKMVSSTTGKEISLTEGYKPTTRKDIIINFLQSKENPILSYLTSFAEGTTQLGQKFRPIPELIDRMIPMLAQDLVEIAEDKGWAEAVGMTLPAIFGTGVQTYGKQIPSMSERGKLEWRNPPSIGERIYNKATGQQVSNIPEDQQKTLSAQHRIELKNKAVMDTAKAEILKNKEGSAQVGDKTIWWDEENEEIKTGSKEDYDKYLFDKSGKKSQIIGDTYYYRDKNGNPKSMTMSEYRTKVRKSKMDVAYNNKDYKEWTKLALEELADIESRFNEADELTKLELLDDYQDLIAKIAKYQSYGGFTKGSGGGSSKKKIPAFSIPESVTAPKKIPIRQAKRPTFSTGKISVKAPQVRKLPVKGITKEYLSKLR